MNDGWTMQDAGVFTLELPENWLMDQPEPGHAIIHDPERELIVTLDALPRSGTAAAREYARADAGEKPSAIEAQGELLKLMACQGAAEELRPAPRVLAGTPYPTATAETIRRRGAHHFWQSRDRWWHKFLPLSTWRGAAPASIEIWRYWAMVNEHLVVRATCHGKAAIVEAARAPVDRIVMSLHLPEHSILTGRRFTEMVVSLARTWFPRAPVAIVDDAHLRIGSHDISLVELHRYYLASPADLPTQVRAFFAEVQSEMPLTELASAWSTVKSHILPTFISPADPDSAGRALREEWVNGLSLAYCLEEDAVPSAPPTALDDDDDILPPARERLITRDDLARWKISSDDLHEQAIQNLVLYSHEHMMQGQKGEGLTMLSLAAADRHNAARILLPDLHRKLREHLGGTFYAAMPTRDTLLAFATSDPDILLQIRRQVQEDFRRAGKGLSGRLFVVTADGIAGE